MPNTYKTFVKEQVKRIVKGTLPEPIYDATIRTIHRAGLVRKMVHAAANNAYYSGQIHTAFRGKPYDHQNRPFLWYSPSMNAFFRTVDFKDRTILEFGAGHSTLWWARHAKSICAIEDNEDWYEYLAPLVSDNVELIHVTDDPEVAKKAVEGRKFDLVIVDCNGGVLDRNVCNDWSTDLISDNGAILFDNSEEHWFEDSIPMFHERGFSRVDFYGIGATKIASQSSSIYFKGDCFLWEGKTQPVKQFDFDDEELSHTPFSD